MSPNTRRTLLWCVLVMLHFAMIAWIVDTFIKDVPVGPTSLITNEEKNHPMTEKKDLEKVLRPVDKPSHFTKTMTSPPKSGVKVMTKDNGQDLTKKSNSTFSEKKVVDDKSNQQKEVQGRISWKAECGDFSKLATKPRDEIFQPIAGSHSYLFSSFAISPTKARIVFVYLKNDSASDFLCRFRYTPHDVVRTDSNPLPVSETVKGSVRLLQDDHGQPYTAAYLDCPLSHNASVAKDLTLSVTYGSCHDQPSNLVWVQRLPTQRSWTFSLCVAPFHSDYNKANDLVEMIELNRILGAEHFYFYNASCSPQVTKVMDYYSKRGLASLIQWHLPRDSNSKPQDKHIKIHYEGQNAAINDCLLRNRNRSDYVVITDVDEFIIPHNPNITTWSELIKSRLAINPKKTNFLVKSSFYRKEWIDPSNTFRLLEKAKKLHSILAQNIQREEHIFPHGTRSKYIANPLLVDEGGIHSVHRHPKHLTDKVPETEALVHHYRRQWHPNRPLLRISDNIVVRKYGEKLVSALEIVRKDIGMT